MNIKVPKPQVAGVDRPPYASDRMWDRLLRTAGLPRSGLKLRTIINFFPAGSVNMCLEAKAPGRDEAPPNLNINVCSVILIRDSRGAPVLTNRNDGCLESIALGYSSVITPSSGVDQAWYTTFPYPNNLSLSYHLLPGERYTLLAATSVNHNHTGDPVPAEALLVAPPVRFVAPSEDAMPKDNVLLSGRWAMPEEQSPLAIPPAPRPTLNAEQQWAVFSRFAGKPLNGVVLEASTPKPGKLLVTLRNRGKERIWIEKWSGQSDYEILIRNPQGRLVRLTDKGKKFFRTFETLDAQFLDEGETIKATLPIGELFDMHAPGDYTVLASLPVLGNLDAILTAAPVRVHVGGKSGP